MDELVQKLSQGEHPVEVTMRPEKSIENLKECLARGYVHVKFTGTRGGTELGVTIDESASDLTPASDQPATGTIRIVGNLRLNYVPVRCIANVSLETFEGEGHLEPQPE